ncbi:MAG: Fic family protein [Candidatus Cryosericum sp.]
MDETMFSQDSPGRLAPIGRGASKYMAYIPNTLPPHLQLDADTLLLLSRADQSLGRLAGIGHFVKNSTLLVKPLIRREAVLSSQIEGTQSGLDDLYRYEADQLLFPTRKGSVDNEDAHEVLNYVIALEYGVHRLESLPVSTRLIRELHRHLMKGVRGDQATPGELRTTQNWIGPAGCTLNEATYVPPPVEAMMEAMGDVEKYIHASPEYPQLIRLALVHYQFEAIHPFVDGNGRVGRLLLALLAVQWSLLPSPLLYLSAYFDRNRDTYYHFLLGVSTRGEWLEWIRFFLSAVVSESYDTLNRLRALQDLKDSWHLLLESQPRTSSLTLRLTDSLMEQPFVTVPAAAKLLGVTYRTAQLHVDRLQQEGILKPRDARRYGKVYEASDILRVLKADTEEAKGSR